MSKKILVAYFSATGVTAKAARLAAEAAGADLFEIRPSRPYTKADLNWNESSSRSSMEMRDPASRPAIESKIENIGQYDTVLVGFPIWWYVAPTIINTFLESYDFSGKTVIPFATSGGSGLGGTVGRLKGSCADTVNWKPGRVLNGMSAAGIAQWVKGLGL